jgi:hypothetical protein
MISNKTALEINLKQRLSLVGLLAVLLLLL